MGTCRGCDRGLKEEIHRGRDDRWVVARDCDETIDAVGKGTAEKRLWKGGAEGDEDDAEDGSKEGTMRTER